MSKNVRGSAIAVFGTFAAILAITLCSLMFTKGLGRVASVWPANALMLALLLRARPRDWPVRLAAAWLANAVANVVTGDSPGAAMALSTLNLAETTVCAVSLLRILGGPPDLTAPRHLAVFTAVSLTAPLPSAAGAVLTLDLLTPSTSSSWQVFSSWWAADALGLLVFAPPALILASGAMQELLAPANRRRTLVCAAVLLTTLSATFLQTRFPFLFLVAPCLVLITFQLGIGGAAWAMLITAVFAIIALFGGLGPTTLTGHDVGLRVVTLQVFLAFMVITTLPLASVLNTRRKLEDGLAAERDASIKLAHRLAEERSVSNLAQEMANFGYWVRRLDTNEVTLSDHMFALYGLPPTARFPTVATRPELFHADDRAPMDAFSAARLEPGQMLDLEFRVLIEGETRWMMARKSGAVLPDGTHAILGAMVDITQVRRVQDDLEHSEHRHRLLIDGLSSYAFFWLDRQGHVESWNSGAQNLKGYLAEEIVGQHFSAFFTPADRKRRLPEKVLKTAAAEGKYETEGWRLRKDGSRFWASVRIDAIRAPDGELLGFSKLAHDESARRATELALLESEARYRELADSAPDLIMRFVRGKIVYASPSCRQYGYEPEDLIGLTAADFVHPGDLAATLRRQADQSAGRTVDANVRREQRVRTASGEWVWMEGNPRQIRNGAGEVVEVINAFRDVTLRRAMEDGLTSARLAAERATQAKTDFMSNMSHELRTPLTAIIGFAGLLKATGNLESREANFAERIDKAGKNLLNLVNDVLTFSKIEAGAVVLESAEVDPYDIAAECISLLATQAEAKGLRMVSEIAPEVGRFAGDGGRLKRVLLDLLSNAVKFTVEGSICLSIRPEGPERLRFAVSDTGPGIPADRAGQIFERYTQVDASVTRMHGGTGLGLAICKGLVEAMSGEIGVDSALGKGSTFWFTVVAPAVADAPKARSVA